MPGNAQPFRMLGGSMTVGRGDANDLVLPDPEKMISSRHCAIEDQDGNLVVIDLSTNGTFLNYGKMALGKTPTPLNNGDILSIGPYELLVEVIQEAAAAAPIADPLPHDPISPGVAGNIDDLTDPLASVAGDKDDFLDELLGSETAGPSSVQRDQLGEDGLMPPLDAEEDFLNRPVPQPDGPAHSAHASALSDVINTPAPATSQIPDDWDIGLDLPAEEEAGPQDDPFAAEPEEAPAAPSPIEAPQPAVAPASPGDTAAARAFLDALGAGGLDIPDAELPETMARLGGVMNTMIAGIRSVLMTRQSIKPITST